MCEQLTTLRLTYRASPLCVAGLCDASRESVACCRVMRLNQRPAFHFLGLGQKAGLAAAQRARRPRAFKRRAAWGLRRAAACLRPGFGPRVRAGGAMEVSALPLRVDAAPAEVDAWVEVSPRTVECWREQAWRGSLDEGSAEPSASGNSSSDDGCSGPGTASISGESTRASDATMSSYSRCAARRAAPRAGPRRAPGCEKVLSRQPCPALFVCTLRRRARGSRRVALTRTRAMCPLSARP